MLEEVSILKQAFEKSVCLQILTKTEVFNQVFTRLKKKERTSMLVWSMTKQETVTGQVQQNRTGRFREQSSTFANNSCSQKRRISLCLEILSAMFI